jgi:hypothetical protein
LVISERLLVIGEPQLYLSIVEDTTHDHLFTWVSEEHLRTFNEADLTALTVHHIASFTLRDRDRVVNLLAPIPDDRVLYL